MRAGRRRAAQTPVILLHGTGSTPEESFDAGYAAALPKLGFPVCTVRFPERALVDLQRSMRSTPCTRCARSRAAAAGRCRWWATARAPCTRCTRAHFWPDLPPLIDDVVGLAGPYVGTQRANESCNDGRCPVTSWQFRFGSDLNRAFAAAPRPAGPSFTAVATSFDELVTPAPDAALLAGEGIVLQDVCPNRSTDHFAIVGDAAAYTLAVDALTHEGAADPARFDPAACRQTTIPGTEVGTVVGAPGAVGNAAVGLVTAQNTDREPPLVCPFDAAACGEGVTTTSGSGPSQASTGRRARLTRSCLRGGALRVRVRGLAGVRRVDFRFGRRLVARDRARRSSAS